MRSVCSDVDGLLLRRQQAVHGGGHRLHVDLEHKETKSKASETLPQKNNEAVSESESSL